QLDFINKIIDATPHILIKDEFREPPPQPAARSFAAGAVAIQGAKPEEQLRGIKGAREKVALLDAMPELQVSPLLRGQIVIRYFGKDEAAAVVGIEPERHRKVSQLPDDIQEGRLEDLHTAANGLVMGDGLARKLGAGLGDIVNV